MKKSTDLFCKINAINTYNCIVISYSTILYHMIIESQLVINVVFFWIKILDLLLKICAKKANFND